MAERFSIRLDLDPGMPEAERMYRDIQNLYAARKGSVPLNRDFGVSWEALSVPTPEVEAMLTTELMEQTEKYVPEASVAGVEYGGGPEGRVVPVVHIERSG